MLGLRIARANAAHGRRAAPRGRRLARRRTRDAGWLALSATLLCLSGALTGSPAAAQAGPEPVDAQFTRCGRVVVAGAHCVVDGDTIRIGERRIRLVGFDTPEKNARCEEERISAERATQALQAWLNRGPFVMSVNAARATDRYGRELQVLMREAGGGSAEALSGYMVGNDFARDYGGGRRAEWC